MKHCNLQCLNSVLLWKQQGQKKVTDTLCSWILQVMDENSDSLSAKVRHFPTILQNKLVQEVLYKVSLFKTGQLGHAYNQHNCLSLTSEKVLPHVNEKVQCTQ